MKTLNLNSFKVEMVVPARGGVAYAVVEVPSERDPSKKYRVDVSQGRCSCPAWSFQKGGVRKPCKHLRALGFVEQPAPQPVKVEDGVTYL